MCATISGKIKKFYDREVAESARLCQVKHGRAVWGVRFWGRGGGGCYQTLCSRCLSAVLPWTAFISLQPDRLLESIEKSHDLNYPAEPKFVLLACVSCVCLCACVCVFCLSEGRIWGHGSGPAGCCTLLLLHTETVVRRGNRQDPNIAFNVFIKVSPSTTRTW